MRGRCGGRRAARNYGPTPALPRLPALTIAHASGRYAVVTGALETLPAHLDAANVRRGPCLVVTDENVGRLHGDRLDAVLTGAGFAPRRLTVAAGEPSKSLGTLGRLYDDALGAAGAPLDRGTPVFALGGGVVGDLAGFLAATLLRGLPLVHLPTTLLAQVDSSLGGKTGINHAAGKNLIGAFHPPALVLADAALLATLPDREFTSGLAEAVKHALVADAGFVAWFEANLDRILTREPAATVEAVAWAQRIKAGIVADDEREAGRRALLNFGHTFGHALEGALGYGAILHGEAVAVGMRAALHLSRRVHPDLPFERLDALVARLPVPVFAPPSAGALLDAMRLDKKRDAAGLRFVLVDAPGHAYVRAGVDAAWVEEAFAHAFG